jgi:hypothetical protein
MVPAKAAWSFNRWLMKSRTHLLAVPPAVNVVVAVALVAVAPVAVLAAVAVVAPVAAMIVIVVVVAVMATIRWKLAAKNWLKSWFTSTAFPRP